MISLPVTANEAKSILKTIWYRKLGRLGHVLRHDNFLYDIIEAKMWNKTTRSRKRMELLHDMTEWKGEIMDS